jgi:hypothetical protein
MLRGKTRSTIGVSIGAMALLLSVSMTAAASGRLAFVNGIPGKRVDVCVNGKEIKSGLKYGKAIVRNLGNGSKALRLRVARSGVCTGSSLGGRQLAIVDGADLTIVGTKVAAPQRVLVWENTEPDLSPGGLVILRHAADIGTAGFKFATPSGGTPWFNAVDDPWTKGVYGWGGRAAGTSMIWWAHQPPAQEAIAGPYQLIVESGIRHESILVGTNLGNVRFARLAVPVEP